MHFGRAKFIGSVLVVLSCLSRVNAQTDNAYVQRLAQRRAALDAKFKDPAQSPLPASERAVFKGLDYFPIDESYRVRAQFISAVTDPALIPRSGKLGELRFTLAGQPQILALYTTQNLAPRFVAASFTRGKTPVISIPFKDSTSGRDTQREGRLLELERLSDNEYILDFNLAANGHCAYNRQLACPAVPPENTLAIAVKAGERSYFPLNAPAPAQAGPFVADIGTLNLASGQTLRNTKISYRTWGALNEAKSNAVLLPSWFMGRSEQLAAYVGADRMFDPRKYFIIATDALGNGVSSSPSNTTLPDGGAFPRLSIRDMVNADYELVTKVLGVRKLYAVAGISMGGMQVFEWLVAYPDLMEKAISIVGTPQQTSSDKLLWTTQLKAIEDARRTAGNGDNAMPLVARIHVMALTTPPYRNRAVPVSEYEKFIEREEANYRGYKSADWAAQLQAMIDHDVTRLHGSSLLHASWVVKAPLLVVAARQDHMVNPDTALEFARLLSANVLEINNDCGHVYANCDSATVNETVMRFLNR
jgi:homoserine O-acetyltransferase